MPKIRVLSAKEIISFFEKEGFSIARQNGSHVRMQRSLISGKQFLVIPNHKTIAIGTLKAIYNQAKIFVPEEKLFLFFYHQN